MNNQPRDLSYLPECAALYATGEWTSVTLGRKYGKDHSTILHHMKKLGIVPDPDATARRLERSPSHRGKKMRVKFSAKLLKHHECQPKVKRAPVADKYAYLFAPDVINRGKTYAEYLAEALTRPAERHYHELYGRIPYALDEMRKALAPDAMLTA
jgi:hypothetical protein